MAHQAQVSADAILDAVGELAERGAVSATGARSLLNKANTLVDNMSKGRDTPETIALRVKYRVSASDVMRTLGDNRQACELARQARDLEEPLYNTAPNDPGRIRLMYDSTLRIADAIDEQNLGLQGLLDALVEYQRAQTYAERLASVLSDNASARRLQAVIHQK